MFAIFHQHFYLFIRSCLSHPVFFLSPHLLFCQRSGDLERDLFSWLKGFNFTQPVSKAYVSGLSALFNFIIIYCFRLVSAGWIYKRTLGQDWVVVLLFFHMLLDNYCLNMAHTGSVTGDNLIHLDYAEFPEHPCLSLRVAARVAIVCVSNSPTCFHLRISFGLLEVVLK